MPAPTESINKATSSKGGTPKEKHVRVIVTRTFQKDLSIDEIIRSLARRLEKPHWAIAVKSLYVFHRCLRDGDPKFMESLQSRSTHIFGLRAFSAVSPSNNVYTIFVKKYARYLEEKASVFRTLGFQFEKEKDPCKGIKPPKAFKVIPKLQSQLNALLNIKMKGQIPDLIKSVYVLLLQDTLPLYAHLNAGLVSLLGTKKNQLPRAFSKIWSVFQLFWKLPKESATRVLKIYQLYIKETQALMVLYDLGRRFVKNLPNIKMPDAHTCDQMEEYIKTAPSGGDDYVEEPEEDTHAKDDFLHAPAGNEDHDEPAGDNDSSEEESSEEEGDPFNIPNNPFAGFTFVTPVFHQPIPFTTVTVTTTQPNPFNPNPSNPFTPVPASPFAQQPNPFLVAPLGNAPAVGNANPFLSSGQNPFGQAPAPAPVGQTPFGQVPAANQNPFNVNPFLPR